MSTAQTDFMNHRKSQEQAVIDAVNDKTNPLASVMTVEVNTTELCNRTCVFCPRIDPEIYPNRNLHLSAELAGKIASDLASFDYKGRVSFSGFGEPVLNKQFPAVIRAVREHLPTNQLDTNTNGDKLTPELVNALFDAGLTYIYANMYDGPEQRPLYEVIFEKAGISKERFKLRPHWEGAEEDYGLFLNNRSGMVTDPDLGLPVIAEPITHPCYYPFSRAMVDWNGDVLICSNDWGRAAVVGNVMNASFADIWLSPAMMEIRKKLMAGDRSDKPCATCNVNGTLSGRFGFDTLVEYYKREGHIKKDYAPMEPVEA
ncbi:MAG: hypothetical protein GKS00_02855 [Alphaproteobacteria bacterium]|nr:hypothetical protein [Alphaproteobacteria bacterium]